MIDPLIKSFLFTLATLLPFLNPPAIAPIFLSMTEGASPETRLMLAKKVGINVTIMLISTMLVGNGILMLFGISLPIVRLGGGMLIMYSAWNLVTANDDNSSGESDQTKSMSLEMANSRSFYPLTFPVTFGPGAIAGAITVGVSLIDEQPSIILLRLSGAIPAILLATFALYICMKFSAQMLNKLGKSGTAVFMRLSAFIMLCLGVQICWVGIQGLVNTFL
ncbi:MAG: NAAT family transporter [Candidatus Kinetoplastibacterium crithidii]|nr:MAG: NAAT family transporter [Candidatus Kinetoplastibacterium crithidii]